MKRNIISLLLVLAAFAVHGSADSTAVKYDSSMIELREFDQGLIDEYKADPDFNYGNKPVPGHGLWERFMIWLNNLINRIFNLSVDTPFGSYSLLKILIYLICFSAMVYALLKLFKVNLQKTFYSSSDSGVLNYDVHRENIHKMDFEELIRDARAQKEYKNAIRLIYLYALKYLSDQHLIQWQAGKTNHDYIHEVGDGTIRRGFSSLSFYFEYAWYGDFQISEHLFKDVNQLFNSWRKEFSE